ncbi:MAG: rare lipoprotein A [Pseudomonadales bacterium]|jgi:rare lipoprotein A
MGHSWVKSALIFFSVLALISCGGSYKSGGGRYAIQQDYGPDSHMDPSEIKDAVPREDPILKAGNKNPYTVLGKTYSLLSSAKGYKERGGASWYGKKFHGHTTSNGEIYNMYGMTAAHKTLPIPSYVKVTNLSNGKATIVRVNDRGPFHSERIIDLSYAAATKLGYIGSGVANVEVETIDVKAFHRAKKSASTDMVAKVDKPLAKSIASKPWLSINKFDNYNDASELRRALTELVEHSVLIDRVGNDYRVKIGPLANNDEADTIAVMLLFAELGKAELIHE